MCQTEITSRMVNVKLKCKWKSRADILMAFESIGKSDRRGGGGVLQDGKGGVQLPPFSWWRVVVKKRKGIPKNGSGPQEG